MEQILSKISLYQTLAVFCLGIWGALLILCIILFFAFHIPDDLKEHMEKIRKKTGKKWGILLAAAAAGTLAGAFPVMADRGDTKKEIPICFKNLDPEETVEIVYGTEDFQIIIDEDRFSEEAGDLKRGEKAEYTFAPKKGDPLSQDIIKVDEEGWVTFDRACEGKTLWLTVTRLETGDCPRTSVDCSFTVLKKPVILEDTYQGLRYSKVYDQGDTRVEHDPGDLDFLEGTEALNFTEGGIEEGDRVKVGKLYGRLPEGFEQVFTDEEGKEQAYPEKAGIFVEKVVLEGQDKENYKVLPEQQPQLQCTVTVKKRPVKLKVSDGTREYGHWNQIEYDGHKPVEENQEAYSNPETEGILEGDQVVFPAPEEIKGEEKPDQRPGIYPERITIAPLTEEGEPNGIPGNNYRFCLEPEEIQRGTLTICRETIEDYIEYLDFEQSGGSFYMDPETGKLWTDGSGKEFYISICRSGQGAFYDQVRLADTGQIISEPSSGQGLDLQGKNFFDEGSAALEIFLYNSVNKAASLPFTVTLCRDSEGPRAVFPEMTSGPWDLEELPSEPAFVNFYGRGSIAAVKADIEDKGCGVKGWAYCILEGKAEEEFTGEKIRNFAAEELRWEEGSPEAKEEGSGGELFLPGEEGGYVILIKAEDHLGNESIWVSQGLIIDWKAPEIKISLAEDQQEASSGIYGEDVSLEICVDDGNPGELTSAVKNAVIKVESGGKITEEKKLYQNREDDGRNLSFSYVVKAEDNNSNDVKITVQAEDNSGNSAGCEKTLMIDTVDPSVEVKDPAPGKGENQRYYQNPVEMEILYQERNFGRDKEHLWFQIQLDEGKEKLYSLEELEKELGVAARWEESLEESQADRKVSERTEERLHRLSLTFNREHDYRITPWCRDLAEKEGGKDRGIKGETQKFVIDRTPPVIQVSFVTGAGEPSWEPEQGKDRYYGKIPAAVVTIQEENFDEKKVVSEVQGKLQGESGEMPSIGPFSGKNGEYKAVIRFLKEGVYSFRIACTDKAENSADEYRAEEFTVDLTEPVIEIFNIEDKSANNNEVAPGIRITDRNFDPEKVKITVTGARQGEVQLPYTVTEIRSGEILRFQDFPREEKTDDFYILTVRSEDKGGNIRERSVEFSVNRFGSVYALEEETRKWLAGKEYVYLNQERSVSVAEYNIDKISGSRILLNRDGELKELREGQDFLVSFREEKGKRQEAHYVLKKENFSQEGHYTIVLSSRDRAGNQMNNTSVKRNAGALPIAFAVDKTGPTVVITGAEDRGVYQSEEKNIIIDAKDNLLLQEVTVETEEEKKVYGKEFLESHEGIIELTLDGSPKLQKIQVTAADAAGNIQGETAQARRSSPVSMRVLVAPEVSSHILEKQPGLSFLRKGAVFLFLLLLISCIIILGYKKKSGRRRE